MKPYTIAIDRDPQWRMGELLESDWDDPRRGFVRVRVASKRTDPRAGTVTYTFGPEVPPVDPGQEAE